ncbi:MAG: hypothetical protein J6Y37_04475 [Paludibacteraceae bacterium]|nr:hypothetical protein [Paludibacteraceae bacterium]
MSGLIDVLGSVLANSGRSTTSAPSNGGGLGGIDIMSVIQAFNKSRGGSANSGMNMNANNGGIDIGSVLSQLGGNNSGSSDLINMILKQVLGGALGGMNSNSSIQTGSTSSSNGPLGNMSMSDIASMAKGAAVILNSILAKK